MPVATSLLERAVAHLRRARDARGAGLVRGKRWVVHGAASRKLATSAARSGPEGEAGSADDPTIADVPGDGGTACATTLAAVLSGEPEVTALAETPTGTSAEARPGAWMETALPRRGDVLGMTAGVAVVARESSGTRLAADRVTTVPPRTTTAPAPKPVASTTTATTFTRRGAAVLSSTTRKRALAFGLAGGGHTLCRNRRATRLAQREPGERSVRVDARVHVVAGCRAAAAARHHADDLACRRIDRRTP